MERKVAAGLLEWKLKHRESALVVRGARHVGKTHSVMEFARANYSHCVYIGFEDEPSRKGIFEGNITASALYERLSYDYPEIVEDDCVLVLDEVELCPRAMYSLKPLAKDGRCDVIAIQSFPMDSDEALSPMGSTETIAMGPMDFEEFLWAMGMTRARTEDVVRHVRERIPFDDQALGSLTDLFRKYIVVGGMPEVVEAYARTSDLRKVSDVHSGILDRICDDAGRYPRYRADRLRTVQCLDSLPRQILDNRVFRYADILGKKGVGAREYGTALMWLEDAGVIDICRNVTEPREPLRAMVRRDSFRVFMKDTGLLVHMMGSDVASRVVRGDPFEDTGLLMQNVIGECLVRKGYDVCFFRRGRSRNGDGTVQKGMEIDLVADLDGTLTAIDLGPLDDGRCCVERRISISDSNLMTDEDEVEHYPLFAPAFFEESRAPDIGPVDVAGLSEALDRETE